MQLKVLIDTNFLLIPAIFNVDIFSEFERILPTYKLYILDKCVEELENITKTQRGKHLLAAKLALSLLQKYPIKTLKTEKHINRTKPLSKIPYVDDIILDFAVKNDYIVATQDKELKEKLKRQRIKTINLRQKKYLIIT
ncbi:nucleotide-binding protein [Candidatus Woesearchaeota archaeon]|nr:nucleotide-binding protein [Candidatus Woesearchaeota archaeon]